MLGRSHPKIRRRGVFAEKLMGMKRIYRTYTKLILGFACFHWRGDWLFREMRTEFITFLIRKSGWCFVFLYLFLYSLPCLGTQNRGKFSITACRPWGLISLVDCDSSRSDRFLSIFLSLPLFPRRKIWCLQANPKFIFISDGANFISLIRKRTGYYL